MTITLPSLPTGSLFGSFPAFPKTTFSWGVNVAGHFYGFKISLPNFTAIPMWILQITEWLAGWIGAYFLFIFQYISDWTINTSTYVIGTLFGIFDSILGTVEVITATAGIFAIPLDMIIIGLMLVALIFMTFELVKGLSKLIGGI